VDPDETTWRRGCRITRPVRTAFDLARWAPTLVEKVVAVDALAYRHRFAIDAVRQLARRHFGVYGSGQLPRVCAPANRLSESPMETRIRLALVLAGLPAPVVQHRVVGFGRSHRLDLAYPDVLRRTHCRERTEPAIFSGPRRSAAAGCSSPPAGTRAPSPHPPAGG
jgi:hypothetical protein